MIMGLKYVIKLKCFYFVLQTYFFLCNTEHVNFGLCNDEFCSGPVGVGVFLTDYVNKYIQARKGEDVEIFVKSYGPKRNQIGVKVKGKKGFIAASLIQENRSLVKNLVPASFDFLQDGISNHLQHTVSSQVDESISWVNSEADWSQQMHTDLNAMSHFHDYEDYISNTYYEKEIESVPNSIFQSPNMDHRFPESSYGAQNIRSEGANFHTHSEYFSHQNNHHPKQVPTSPFAAPQSSQGFYDAENISPSTIHHTDAITNIGNTKVLHRHVGVKSNLILPSHSEWNSAEHVQDNQLRPQPTSFVSQSQVLYDSSLPNHNFGRMDSKIPNSMQPGLEMTTSYQQNIQFSESVPPNSYFPNFETSGFVDSNQFSSEVLHTSVQPNALFQTQNIQPSLSNPNNFDSENMANDEDMSRTLALLQKQGISDENIFGNEFPSQTVPAEQNIAHNDYPIQPDPSQSNYFRKDTSGIASDPIVESRTVSDSMQKSMVDPDSDMIDQESEEFSLSDDEEVEIDDHLEVSVEQSEVQNESESKQSNNREIIPENVMQSEQDSNNVLNNFLSKDPKVIIDTKHSDFEEMDRNENGSVNEEDQSQVAKFAQNIQNSNHKESKPNYDFQPDSSSKGDSLEHTTQNLPFNENSMSEKVSETSNSLIDVDPKEDSIPHHLKKLSDDEQTILSNAVNEKLAKSVQVKSEDIPDARNTYGKQNIFEAKNDTPQSTINEHDSNFENLLNMPDSNEIPSDTSENLYQKRNLKGDVKSNTDIDSDGEENSTDSEIIENYTFENGLEALRSFVETVISWIPEPFYSILMDLDQKGVPHRVPVFTALSAVPCVLLIIAIVYIKERSKENKLSAQLIAVEKNAYTLSAEKNILEEKLETTNAELAKLETALNDEKNNVTSLFKEVEYLKEKIKITSTELHSSLDEIEMLRQKEDGYLALVEDFDKEKTKFQENKDSDENKLQDLEDSIAKLNDLLQENECEIKDLKKERLDFLQYKEDSEEKLAQFQQNCNQLLKEAEVWNLRVTELNEKLNQESILNKELEANLALKQEEIESLKSLVETFQSFDNLEDSEMETQNSKEEKLQYLLNSSMVLVKLQKQEEENTLLIEKLETEKKKILDMEVDMLDARSEIDKLKLSYNQALQDKAEAQTKLDVLTNYFKDKEIQLQKQLGAQEAVRQKKEEDASSAERRIILIEQENASYKYQVASMKQEMEETERNLKTQIAAQEKKAHENWIAARAAERKLEDVKQEVTQLRQRLTMLEREQESWANASQEEILRPVPKRVPPINDNALNSQDINPSIDMRPPWPPMPHDHILPPPMMLPPDRPLPPLPPPPMHPFLPPLEPPFRPQPWHLPPESGPGSDFRSTPPEFLRGRETTPPRGRQANFNELETAPNASSPSGTDTRDSRNSTPPHSLPDFHDIPPQPPRSYFPHPGPISRFPMPPPFRRDIPLGPKRIDNQDDFNSVSRGAQQPPVPHERWQHSNTRV